jgi:hypothetical protein
MNLIYFNEAMSSFSNIHPEETENREFIWLLICPRINSWFCFYYRKNVIYSVFIFRVPKTISK